MLYDLSRAVMCVIVKKHAIFKHKKTTFLRKYISYENLVFFKGYAELCYFYTCTKRGDMYETSCKLMNPTT